METSLCKEGSVAGGHGPQDVLPLSASSPGAGSSHPAPPGTTTVLHIPSQERINVRLQSDLLQTRLFLPTRSLTPDGGNQQTQQTQRGLVVPVVLECTDSYMWREEEVMPDTGICFQCP